MHSMRSVALVGPIAAEQLFELQELLGPTFALVRADSAAADPQDLAAAFGDTGAVIAVLPARSEKSHRRVMFEIGLAVGAEAAVVIVSDEAPPSSMRALTWLRPAALDEIVPMLGLATRKAQNRSRKDVLGPATDAAYHYNVAYSRPDDAQGTIDDAVQALKDAGVEIAGTEFNRDNGLDLVVWHDSLAKNFGLPLAVEFKRGNVGTRPHWSYWKRALATTGAQTLLVLATDESRPIAWTDNASTILMTDCGRLVRALRGSTDPGAALEALMQEVK